MFEYLYEWMKNIAFYMVLITAVIHILPNSIIKVYPVLYRNGAGRHACHALA